MAARHSVLVVDVVGSTRLYDDLGDATAKAIITDCLDVLAAIVAEHDGRVVASIGDELVCVFPDAVKASVSASEMHGCVEKRSLQAGARHPALQLRIGIHSGDIIAEPFDAVSEVAAITRRTAGLAKAEQTLITGTVLAELPGIYRAMTRFVDREAWRGAETTWLELHELIWAVEGLTVSEPGAQIPVSTTLRVRLRLGEREWICDERRPFIAAGRVDNNDIIVDSDLASRQHFTLKFRDGRCTLTDMSTNATWVVDSDGNREQVWKAPFVLRGEGTIHCGEPGEGNQDFAILYRCE